MSKRAPSVRGYCTATLIIDWLLFLAAHAALVGGTPPVPPGRAVRPVCPDAIPPPTRKSLPTVTPLPVNLTLSAMRHFRTSAEGERADQAAADLSAPLPSPAPPPGRAPGRPGAG